MKLLSSFAAVLLGLAASPNGVYADSLAGVAGSLRTANIYIQPVTPSITDSKGKAAKAPVPSVLAQIRYSADEPWTPAQVAAYGVPESADSTDADALYRIGIYDPDTKAWSTATSVVAATNFAKGYRPSFVLSLGEAGIDGQHKPFAVSFRGIAIDAGQTRDFGPQATVVVTSQGASPVLNRPVVLSPQGKKVDAPEEKTFLQKYWWAIGIAVLVLATGGGGE